MAATTQLGTFSYDMVLNYAKWTDQLTKAERAAEKSSAAIQKSIEGFIDTAAGIAGAIAGAFSVDKLLEFGKQAIDTADQFNKMSQKVGVSVESLSALATQAKLSDVSVESLQGGLAKLAKNAVDAAAGGKENAAVFAAMGVSLKDANGNLKSTEDILAAVATKFATYKDSAEKTALAQKAFGKSGADLIPLLNQLGEGGFKKAREEAERFGQVISTETAAQAEEFNDNITKIGFGLSGVANAIVADLLPSLVSSSRAFADWINSDAVRNGVKGLVEDIGGLVSILAQVPGEIAATDRAFQQWNGTLGQNSGSLDIVLDKLKSFTNFKPGAPVTISWKMPEWFEKLTSPTAGSGLDYKMTKALVTPINDLGAALKIVVPDVNAASVGFDGLATHVQKAGTAAGTAKAPIVAVGDAAGNAADKLKQTEAQAGQFLSTLDAVGADKYTQALSKYNEQLDKAAELYAKLIKNGEDAAKAQEFLNDANARAAAGFDSVVQSMRNQNDASAILETSYARSESDLNNQIRLLGMDEESRRADELATRLNIAALGDLKDFMGPLTESQQALIDKNKALAESFVSTSTEINKQRDVATTFVRIWEQAGDQLATLFGNLFTGQIESWSDFGRQLVNIAKQMVSQIIAEFIKLAAIQAFGGGGGGGMNWASLFAGALGGSGGSGGSGGYNMGGPSGASSGGGAYGQFMQYGTSALSQGGGGIGAYSSLAGPALTVAGIYGGYRLGSQLTGSQAGGYAGAGAVAVASYFVPIVGWIMGALEIIDLISGGKLFGTDGKFNFGKQQTFIGANGATTVAGYDMKGQSALFGGSTHEWHSIDVDQRTQDAWNQFLTQVINGNGNLADQLGTQAGQIVSAEFDAIFDKKGNIKSTSSIVNGVTYNEDDKAFQLRVVAETMLNTLENFSKGISAAVDQYRADAQQLYAVTQQLANAGVFLHNGGTFLALGTDQSLTALLDLAQGAQQFGESIDQTLQRIMQAQQQYDQFVGQFKVQTFASPFQAALADIDAQQKANFAQAEALAHAAGAEHAATQDLINIHNYAAEQFAAAVKKLKADANSLVASLGYGMPQSLDEINARIAELEGSAGNGANAIGGFSNAMTQAASAAQHAMDLLLGDLSPLNDQQKLQQALKGLRSGTVTAEQVLEIGRRLYATGSDYNALFAQVMATRGGGGPSVGSVGHLNTGGANAQELAELKRQRDAIEKANQHADALRLAQQIADLVSAEGITIDQALQEIGLTDLPAFMKELGITSRQGFDDMITNLEKNTDSAGDTTSTLSDGINTSNDLLTEIRDELRGYQSPDHPLQPGQLRGGGLDANTDAINNLNRNIRGHANGNRSSRTPPGAMLVGGG